MNGELVVTYDDFESFGIRRKTIAQAIQTAVALGFLDLTERGRRSYGPSRRPSHYGLTWLPRADWTPASNMWKQFNTKDEAQAALERALLTTHAKHMAPLPGDIRSRGGPAPRTEAPIPGQTTSSPDGGCAPDMVTNAPPQTSNKRHRGNSSLQPKQTATRPLRDRGRFIRSSASTPSRLRALGKRPLFEVEVEGRGCLVLAGLPLDL
jgi:hypothetical protein